MSHRNWNKRQKSSLPDRWEAYSNSGNRIPGTRFICMKVPLKEDLCRRLPRDQWFTPSQMVHGLTEQGMNLRLLIDLTNTDRYYHPKELQDLGIDYTKIAVMGHQVPGKQELKRFCDIVDRFENEHQASTEGGESIVIGVHCTHGINRTGYLVCRYLIDRKGWSAEVAISEFNQARGHSIERENYLEALRGIVSKSARSSVEQPWNHGIRRQTHNEGSNWPNFAPNKKTIFDQDGQSRLSLSFCDQYTNPGIHQGQWQDHHVNSNYRWNRNQSDNYRHGHGQWSEPVQHNYSRYGQDNYGWRQDSGVHRPQYHRDNYYHPYYRQSNR